MIARGGLEQPEQSGAAIGGYDPADHTVVQVQEYVTEHEDERAAILALEQSGKARSTLLAWLAS